MYYMNNKQNKIMDLVKNFGCLTTKQIENITGFKDVDGIMRPLLKQTEKIIKKEDDRYLLSNLLKIDEKMLNALEVYSYLSITGVPITWCQPVEFPFTISLFRNGKVFDIAVLEEGEEVIFCTAIDRSISKRVIVVIRDLEQVKKIKLNKPCKICLLNPEVKFYDLPASK